MELRRVEAFNVVLHTTDWDIEKLKQYVNWLSQFGGIYCPKRYRKIVEFDLNNGIRIDKVRRI